MKKVTRFFLLMTSALVACVLGLNAYVHVIAGVPLLNIDLVRTLAYLILCAFGMAVLVVLWREGRIPFGFFYIVFFGYFLGVASRSPSSGAEVSAAFAFTCFIVGCLIVREAQKHELIKGIRPPDPELRRKLIERLLTDRTSPRRAYHPAPTVVQQGGA
ncbi:MAG: hypothetical protein O7B35_11570 [Deltaproteobacteria bacterium]|nr:hypothetical protein [Deltaproteobacteria bacterium]